ncbi:response regulator transcription factor [Haloarcula onubensis]|uniref:HalX domain-containing protein n=1 Tax=Haloarcula onubensis TaxID=2950539 RepID=A0ABU2FTB8_9EURY|nr:HalX domain-containing protein [Halomicroarcula sp. S3CR25-11]MDS0283532.1 HalX domain-containing protein [Halomicroarcula sp. S3CR25-11]
MQTTATEEATVLVVDDERDVAELYSAWLDTAHDVRSANGGREALGLVDGVDVVFLDRQMPEMSGDEVLAEIERRGVDCRVVMVTAVTPDFDIVEMPFDDYLTKPVDRTDLLETVETMRTRDSYDEQVQEYFAMASKKATLEAEKNPVELDAHEEYREVSERVETLREAANAAATEIDDFESAFRDFPSG